MSQRASLFENTSRRPGFYFAAAVPHGHGSRRRASKLAQPPGRIGFLPSGRWRSTGPRVSESSAMEAAESTAGPVSFRGATERTAYTVLAAISFCHLLNDMMQSLLPAIYPMLKSSYSLTFGQIGLLTFTYQITASLLQPVIGLYTDRKPKPYSLAAGMAFTLCGLMLLSVATTFGLLLVAASLVGTGSSVFHPESSRVARMASGGRHGFAQSVFQVGGNAGSAIGPLLAAVIVLPHGRKSVAWFGIAALLGMFVLTQVGHWYKGRGGLPRKARIASDATTDMSRGRVLSAIGILLCLIFSKFFYMASISSYYTFYLISHFQVSVQSAQIHLFVFSGSVAVGTIAGGPLGDRFGRK